MATKLRKSIKREVVTSTRTLTVELTPEGIVYNEKRRRTKYLLPHALAFQHAAALHASKQVVLRVRGVKRGPLGAR